MQTTVSEVSTESSAERTYDEVVASFGRGRYSPLMKQIYDQAQVVFSLEPTQAESLAHAAARDLGAIMANSPAHIKFGRKISDDGKITITEAARVKGVTITNSLLACRALDYAKEAGVFGFLWGKTQWKVSEELQHYFDSL